MMADRISNLPSEIIERILTYVPLKDAVSTSILSKTWRRNWVTIPHLKFDEDFEECLIGKYNFEAVVDQILELHDGPLTKFVLRVFDVELSSAVNLWLLLLLEHPIEELDLILFEGCCDNMPMYLFSFDQLKILTFECYVELELPSEFKGFPRLERLAIFHVTVVLQELIKLLSICPELKYLELQFVNIYSDPEEIPNAVISINELLLRYADFTCRDYAICFLTLIRSSPNLRILNLIYFGCCDSNPSLEYLEPQLKEAQSNRNVPVCSLEYVEICDMPRCAEDVIVIKILLLWATGLKKLEIKNVNHDAICGLPDGRKMLLEIASFGRASKNAEITYESLPITNTRWASNPSV